MKKFSLILGIALVALMALVIIFWPASQVAAPSGSLSSAPSGVSEKRLRPVDRDTRMSPRPGSRSVRDYSTLMKLVGKFDFSKFPMLTRDQIDHYLEVRSRSAPALLTAFHLSRDHSDQEAFLREAMEKFPNDPQVQFASFWLFSEPEKRLEILETLKLTDPENGIVDCLSAKYLFDLGKNDEAFAALSQSDGKPIRDYTMLSSQNCEEAYLEAGFPPLEAKIAAVYGQAKPLLIEMPDLADGLMKQRASDQSAGDDAAVLFSREIQVRLASQLQQGGSLIDTLVGMVVEKGAIKEIDSPEAHARMEEIELQRAAILDASKRVTTMMENSAVPENDWLLYFDRVKLFGDSAANDWMLEKHPDL